MSWITVRSMLSHIRLAKTGISHQVGRLFSSSHEELWGPESLEYSQYLKDRKIKMNELLTSSNRFQKISDREDRHDYPVEATKMLCKGMYSQQHRGCSILKTCVDKVIYQELFERLRPATVIELGTCSGGSAVWMADILRMLEVNSTIYTVDIDPSNIEERVMEIKPDNMHMIQGDTMEIEKIFPKEKLKSLPHPWIVIEDAHTNIYGLMEYLGSYMETGDYFIIEDLHPNIPGRMGYGLVHDDYKTGGPLITTELRRFLTDHNEEYSVDSFYCDFFGYNGTWNMNGYIRKM